MEKQKTNIPASVLLSLFLIIGIGLASGWVWYQQLGHQNVVEKLTTSIANQQAQIEQLKTKDQVQEKFENLQDLEKLESTQVLWSVLAVDIFKTLSQVSGLSIQSLASSEEGVFNIQLTAPSPQHFGDLVSVLRAHEKIEDGFVLNINKASESEVYAAQVSFLYPF